MLEPKEAMPTISVQAPETLERRIRTDLGDTFLSLIYFKSLISLHILEIKFKDLPRRLVAPDVYHPEGTKEHKHHHLSVLQQHVAFFELDDNGIVYPRETYTG
ncbi:hypothetical protein ZIOFF_027994 [Zingiber officinale]|uniref:Uncharacterized protein n=1 Tax=Zingiber officinale TaxID=94328 RepID=A0A8J5GUA7_ZINOF|nr:hypothetical protein ZIOFF_027994 [Zingiber officinale]